MYCHACKTFRNRDTDAAICIVLKAMEALGILPAGWTVHHMHRSCQNKPAKPPPVRIPGRRGKGIRLLRL